MRRLLGRQRALQLELFCRPPQRPDWRGLPEAIQRRARLLLARMLRAHPAQHRAPAGGPEVTDE